MNLKDLEALRERVRALAGPDRQVDVLLSWLWPNPPFNRTTEILRNARGSCPEFTGEIGDTLKLLKTVRPKCWYRLGATGGPIGSGKSVYDCTLSSVTDAGEHLEFTHFGIWESKAVLMSMLTSLIAEAGE